MNWAYGSRSLALSLDRKRRRPAIINVDDLTPAQRLKFLLLAGGASVTPEAVERLDAIVEGGQWSPADYASTKGLILRLEDDVWVNMPVERYNPAVATGSSTLFDVDDDGFVVIGAGLVSRAEFWRPPAYLGATASNGRPIKNFVVGHGDRVRLSPTIGCAMTCDFCNIPFDDTYAGLKPVDIMVESLRTAFADPIQPAQHILISGGTPGPPHVAGLREVYERVISEFPQRLVDIMMVPVPGLFDLPHLDALGLNQISINLEIYDETVAEQIMRHKHRQGRQYYLDFIEAAAELLGPGRVRSMLMVGLEPMESTLAGVRALLDRGCVPVLSPFLPDPVTPMVGRPFELLAGTGIMSNTAPTAEYSLEVFLRASDLASEFGVSLGPDCVPCMHNTMTLPGFGAKPTSGYVHHEPLLTAGV